MIWSWFKRGYTYTMARLEDVLADLQGKSWNRRRADSVHELNMAIVDLLIAKIKEYNKAGKTQDAKFLIKIANSVLNSNKAYSKLIEDLMKEPGSS